MRFFLTAFDMGLITIFMKSAGVVCRGFSFTNKIYDKYCDYYTIQDRPTSPFCTSM